MKAIPDQLKYELSFTMYKDIKNERQNSEPDFQFFEKIKDYWILLFKNRSKKMFFPLLMTLSFVLKKSSYYNSYKEYFFQLINEEIRNSETSGDYFLYIDKIAPAISKNNPDDLIKTLSLFLNKGDSARGYIPFSYEVKQKLIPEIKKMKNRISPQKIVKIEQELQKYNESLS